VAFFVPKPLGRLRAGGPNARDRRLTPPRSGISFFRNGDFTHQPLGKTEAQAEGEENEADCGEYKMGESSREESGAPLSESGR
jgi:hypothetical protein